MEERLAQVHTARRQFERLRQLALAHEDQHRVARCEDVLLRLEQQLAILEGHALHQTPAPADPPSAPFRRSRTNY